MSEFSDRAELLDTCSKFPLYGPEDTVQSLLLRYLHEIYQLSDIVYVLNMLNSNNLPWINCMMSLGV